MSSVSLGRRPILVALALAALAGPLLWGRVFPPGDTAAEDSGPQVIATIPLGSSFEEVQLTGTVAVDPERNRIYVVSNMYDAEKVFIVDGSTNTVTDTVVAGEYIYGIGVNPATNRMYLSISSALEGPLAGVQVMDGQTKAILDYIEGIWGEVAVDPAANRIFTHDTSGWDDLLAIIDGATHEVSTVKVGSSHYIETFIPEVNPQTGLVYVSYSGDDMVTVVDPAAKAVVTKIDIGGWPGRPVINSQTNRIYLKKSDETVVVDGASHSVVARIPGEADAIAVNSSTNRIYRVRSGEIEVIDGATNNVVTTLSWSEEEWGNYARGAAVNPQTNRLYIAAQVGSDEVVAVVEDAGAAPPPGPPPSPTPTASPVPPAQGTIHNCPQAGKWAISVWEGQDGADTGQALANCGAGAVDYAYYIDPSTQDWLRWFGARPDPDVSNLRTLSSMQAVLTYGAPTAAAGEVRAAGSLAATQGAAQMENCPQAGKWAISVWDGDDGTDTAEALATCADGVAYAYYIDPETQDWLRWFAARPDPAVSNLRTLNHSQGVLAYGTPAVAQPTPTPTPTPIPTPTVSAAGDVILVSSNAFTTTSSLLIDGESRQWNVVGELRNESSTPRSAGDIVITIYDATGNAIGQRRPLAFDDVIRPGRTTAFHDWVPSMSYFSDETNDYPEGWATYEITLSPRDPYSVEGPPLEVTVHDVQASIGDYGWLYIRGTVRNDDSRPQKWSGDVYAILYDEEDKILNASRDPFDVLQPGQSTEFEITFYDDEPIDYSRYLVQAYADAE